MARALSQAQVDRLRLLCQVHSDTTAAMIVGCTRPAVKRARLAGWKAGTNRNFRPRPTDFSIQCRYMTVKEMERHYHATGKTVRRWCDEVGVGRRNINTAKPSQPIPADLPEVVATLGVEGAAKRYGVHWNTVNRWRHKLGLPFRKRRTKAQPLFGWVERYAEGARA